MIPGRLPLLQVAPLSVEVEKTMSDPPPSVNRPVCEAITMVDPNEYVSGSTWVACWLVVLVNVSLLIWMSATLAYADGAAMMIAARVPAPMVPALAYQEIRMMDGLLAEGLELARLRKGSRRRCGTHGSGPPGLTVAVPDRDGVATQRQAMLPGRIHAWQ